MNVGYLIVARLKSTRLPRKVLREVCGRPMLAHMLDRLKLCRPVNHLVICTSTNPQDDPLEEFAAAEGVEIFRGEEEDVLKRLSDAADAFHLDYILSITADCPFADPGYAEQILDAYRETEADYIRALDLPHGAFSYGLKPAALKTILEIKDSEHTEVWGRYFSETGLFSIYDFPIVNPNHRRPTQRMTLDYPEDLAFFEAVFAALYRPGQVFTLDEILEYLDAHPEVVALNAHCQAAYLKRWRRQMEIKLKERFPVKRAALIGCESIGQRHLRNLRELGVTDMVALRTRQGHHQQLDPAWGVREVTEWDALLDARPDVAIISNPTSLHLDAAMRLAPHVRGLFVEKPLAESPAGIPELLETVRRHRVVSFVGYNLQFHPLVVKLGELLESDDFGQPISFQCQVGQWLPDRHPYEDSRTAYYARPDLGGGVTRTLCHELHLVTHVLGTPHTVAAMHPAVESLPLDVDVAADIMMHHASGAVSQVHLDFLQHLTHRMGVISCERGWIAYDLIANTITAQRAGDAAPAVVWRRTEFDGNEPYLEEMRVFLRYVREGRVHHQHDMWAGANSQAVIDAVFSAARTGANVSIDRLVHA